MKMPYRIATLLYCFNRQDQALLMRRAQEPNLGLWSPCGGKLHMAEGESPYACACREALEEIGLDATPRDLHLTGLVSEHGYQGADPLADVFVRGQAAAGATAAAAPRKGAFVFRRGEMPGFTLPADRPRANLALVLAISGRLFRRPLPLPRRWQHR